MSPSALRHGHYAGPWSTPAPGHRIDRLPGGVETILLAGLTYYVLGGIYYQQQNGRQGARFYVCQRIIMSTFSN
ncbi:hypothetical protein [Aeromonas salmonicida]